MESASCSVHRRVGTLGVSGGKRRTEPVLRAPELESKHSTPLCGIGGRYTRTVLGGAGATGIDVAMLALDKDRAIQPLLQTPFLERNGEVSPNGRWLAYESNDSGEFEIFVRPFPDVNAGKWPVSTGGGTQPLWARNGQELFYVAPDGVLMSVPVGRGALLTAGTPIRLIEGQYYRGTGNVARTYDVSLDGTRFLMIKQGGASEQPSPSPTIVVVQNWVEELKRRVPTK